MIKRLFGKTADGKDVYSYVLYNGKIALTVLSLGATVQSVKYDGRDIVLGYDTVAEYEKNDGYLGAVIGRYANRISGASFKIGKKKYNLSANEGQNSLDSYGKVLYGRLLVRGKIYRRFKRRYAGKSDESYLFQPVRRRDDRRPVFNFICR